MSILFYIIINDEGTYNNGNMDACSVCPDGEIVNDDKTDCDDCQANEITNLDRTECIPCDENSYPDPEVGMLNCIACASGAIVNSAADGYTNIG